MRDIQKGEDLQIQAVINVVAAADPDILLLTRFDFDLGQHALTAFADKLAETGVTYPFSYSAAPNSGVATGRDMDGDGYLGDARDAQGYGAFAGQGGMAILSRYPIDDTGVRDFSGYLWRDLPGANLPEWPADSPVDMADQRLSSVAHWDVPIMLPGGARLNLLAYHATTPAFDGPQDRNGLRNQDETMFWLRYLEGALAPTPPDRKFVIIGDANLDPADGDGNRQAIRALLGSRFVQDPEPASDYAQGLSRTQGGVNATHRGNPALDTADWKDIRGPGNLRVDYVLPSAEQTVIAAGVVWPAPDDMAAVSNQRGDVSWHGLVWVDIAR